MELIANKPQMFRSLLPSQAGGRCLVDGQPLGRAPVIPLPGSWSPGSGHHLAGAQVPVRGTWGLPRASAGCDQEFCFFFLI